MNFDMYSLEERLRRTLEMCDDPQAEKHHFPVALHVSHGGKTYSKGD